MLAYSVLLFQFWSPLNRPLVKPQHRRPGPYSPALSVTALNRGMTVITMGKLAHALPTTIGAVTFTTRGKRKKATPGDVPIQTRACCFKKLATDLGKEKISSAR